MSKYSKGSHTVYYHRYHIVWITKYRYKMLSREMKEKLREIISHVSEEMGVYIENGVVSSDYVHIFVSIPPHIAVSDFVHKAKGRSSRKLQMDFQHLLKDRYWGRGYFSTTSGHITDEIINNYINNHVDAHKPDSMQKIKLE